MKFTLATAVALFGASAIAAPAPPQEDAPRPSENIDIAEFSVRKYQNGTVADVSFLLSGDDATDLDCQANTGIPSDVITCGDSKYRFTVRQGTGIDYILRIYHELGIASGYWGEGSVFTHCRAGGLGSLLCDQVFPKTIVIDSTPPPVNP
ncbi:hypothetical protein CTA2_11375 [Colletotrichum tanaceti]|uniref:AA1-like domain-containing protein n=1 Tax=Colletotrichum tanaceti TaxID=1306861 RepID=A0A4U6XNE6_9PEZI|nr:hypothetical protein CTA2_11375 [Colletotrichum tanaceti]TKW57234.1 hypothetical protein CTA1_2240 [Colletotrichum tanaceti]